MSKTYVLDTSVLLSSPGALFAFEEHAVVVPLVVLKELEGKRHDPVLGLPARQALRSLEQLRVRGDLREGVEINDLGGSVRIEINHVDQSGLPDALQADRTHDTRILAVARNLANDGNRVVVVSKDMPMRLLADTLGLEAQEYLNEQVVVEDAYTGIIEIDETDDTVSALYEASSLDVADFAEYDGVPANTGVVLIGPSSSALGVLTENKTLDLVRGNTSAFGVKGRSAEQRIALHHLTNDDTPLVSLGGRAGAGKTFLALAAALEAVLEQRTHDRIMVFRPLHSVGGQELGYLPGTAEEKMGPWGAAIFDALRAMTTQDVIDEVVSRGLLEVLPLTHIRGRSLTNSFVIVDEAQNLERSVLLTALTRLGEGSKMVLSWDAAQRDNLRVGRYDGVAALVERLKGQPLFAHTTFTRSERGPVAEMASRLLDDFGA